jgi:hypothetical protein
VALQCLLLESVTDFSISVLISDWLYNPAWHSRSRISTFPRSFFSIRHILIWLSLGLGYWQYNGWGFDRIYTVRILLLPRFFLLPLTYSIQKNMAFLVLRINWTRLHHSSQWVVFYRCRFAFSGNRQTSRLDWSIPCYHFFSTHRLRPWPRRYCAATMGYAMYVLNLKIFEIDN